MAERESFVSHMVLGSALYTEIGHRTEPRSALPVVRETRDCSVAKAADDPVWNDLSRDVHMWVDLIFCCLCTNSSTHCCVICAKDTHFFLLCTVNMIVLTPGNQ